MNWKEIRDRLVEINPDFAKLPEEWQWRIDLRGANLRDANLRGANLRGADLGGAILNFTSHDLMAEVLFRVAGGDWDKRKLAGGILISHDWCWKEFLAIDDPLKKWALTELTKWVKDGDNAPEILKKMAAKSAHDSTAKPKEDKERSN